MNFLLFSSTMPGDGFVIPPTAIDSTAVEMFRPFWVIIHWASTHYITVGNISFSFVGFWAVTTIMAVILWFIKSILGLGVEAFIDEY